MDRHRNNNILLLPANYSTTHYHQLVKITIETPLDRPINLRPYSISPQWLLLCLGKHLNDQSWAVKDALNYVSLLWLPPLWAQTVENAALMIADQTVNITETEVMGNDASQRQGKHRLLGIRHCEQ